MSYSLLKAIHILAVVLWIGGVAFVTFILIPAIRNFESEENQYLFFERVEHKFAWQARFTTLAAGVSGFMMVEQAQLWHRFSSLEFWWMHAMLIVWLLFTLMLFVFEPLFLHKYFLKKAEEDTKALMKRVQFLHVILVSLSLITVLGAMLATH